MTWTCTICARKNNDGLDVCPQIGCQGKKPAGLSEEERAALPRLRRWANEMREAKLLNDGHVEFMTAYAMQDLAAARAPLEAELLQAREREAMAILERDRARKDSSVEAARLMKVLDGVGFELGRDDYPNGKPIAEIAKELRERVRELEKREADLEREWDRTKAQLAQAQKPAAPAGLPEVVELVELAYLTVSDERVWVRGIVTRHDGPRRFYARVLEGKNEGKEWQRYLADENQPGATWRRLPPAQTSREPGKVHGDRVAPVEYGPPITGHVWKPAASPPAQTSGEPLRQCDVWHDHYNRCREPNGHDGPHYDGDRIRWDQSPTDTTERPPKPEPPASPPGEVELPIDATKKSEEWHLRSKDRTLLAMLVAVEADIRAAVERETAELRNDLDYHMHEAKKDKARIAELEGFVEYNAGMAETERKERDAALAGVEGLRKQYSEVCRDLRLEQDRANELARKLAEAENRRDQWKKATVDAEAKARAEWDRANVVAEAASVDRRAKIVALAEVKELKAVRTAWQAASGRIVEYLEPSEKCVMATPEETERVVRETVERLKGELALAKEARRCPADGMSDEQVADILYEAILAGPSPDNWKRVAAKARELFTPIDLNSGKTNEQERKS